MPKSKKDTYTKKQREDAIMICDLAASTDCHFHDQDDRGPYAVGCGYYSIATTCWGYNEYDLGAMDLAIMAYDHVRHETRGVAGWEEWTRATDAQAAMLLREGFTP